MVLFVFYLCFLQAKALFCYNSSMVKNNDHGRNNSSKPFFKKATISYLRYREWELGLFGRGLEKFGYLIPKVGLVAPLAGKIMQPFGRAAGQAAAALERGESPDYQKIASGILNDQKAQEALTKAMSKGPKGNKPDIA